MFADDYPRFIEVSDLTAGPAPQDRRRRHRDAEQQRNRMNERYEAIFGDNRDVFDGARVLDLASHDGRYSFAALRTGATHVTGVEVRQALIDKAQETFAFYGQDPDTYRFVCGDVFEVLAREEFDVDVVLCLGYLYHTYRHTELMFRLHQLAPRHLIVDTMVSPGTEPTLKLHPERDPDDIRSAAPDTWSVDRVLVAWPTVPALEILVNAYGFEIESTYDWPSRLANRPAMVGLQGYAKGRRVTVRCRARGTAPAAGRKRAVPLGVRTERPAAPAPPPAGWRGRVNRTLARTTGYELRRVHAKR